MASSDPGPDSLPVSPTSTELPAGGTVRPVTRWGTEVMHREARSVTSYDEELRSLVACLSTVLSELESRVLSLYLDGYSYTTIGE